MTPKKIKAEPGHENDAFLDPLPDTSKPIIVLDRSTLEAYATCPQAAQNAERGVVNTGSHIADAGNEGFHAAASATIWELVDSQGGVDFGGSMQTFWNSLHASRPDVQPEAIKGAKASVYAFCAMLHKEHWSSVMRFDGGEGDYSGQLAVDYDFGVAILRCTSEIDFLAAGASKKCAKLRDWKTGNKTWTAAEVKDSFQFQMHAWLILENFSELEAVEIEIWNTRINRATYAVDFERKNIGQYEWRVKEAASQAYQYREAENPPTWPNADKCSMCDSAAICPEAGKPIADLAKDPVAFLKQMTAVSERLTAMKKLGAAHVKRTGKDIIGENGTRFGTEKPKKDQAKSNSLYTLKGE